MAATENTEAFKENLISFLNQHASSDPNQLNHMNTSLYAMANAVGAAEDLPSIFAIISNQEKYSEGHALLQQNIDELFEIFKQEILNLIADYRTNRAKEDPSNDTVSPLDAKKNNIFSVIAKMILETETPEDLNELLRSQSKNSSTTPAQTDFLKYLSSLAEQFQAIAKDSISRDVKKYMLSHLSQKEDANFIEKLTNVNTYHALKTLAEAFPEKVELCLKKADEYPIFLEKKEKIEATIMRYINDGYAEIFSYEQQMAHAEGIKAELEAYKKRLDPTASEEDSPYYKTYLKEKAKVEAQQKTIEEHKHTIANAISSCNTINELNTTTKQLLKNEHPTIRIPLYFYNLKETRKTCEQLLPPSDDKISLKQQNSYRFFKKASSSEISVTPESETSDTLESKTSDTPESETSDTLESKTSDTPENEASNTPKLK